MGGIIIVVVFVLLMNLDGFYRGVKSFFRFISPVLLSMFLAYMMNQLSRFYQRTVFKPVKQDKLRKALGIFLTVVTVVAFITFLAIMLIPQLIDSLTTFFANLERYERSAEAFLRDFGLFKNIDLTGFFASSENLLDFVSQYTMEHLNNLISTVATTGRGIVSVLISFILAVYMMAEKDLLKKGFAKLVRSIFKGRDESYASAVTFLRKCDSILTRFVVYNFLDALIVGIVNFLFMVIFNLPYSGLISFVVAITNLVPTFGPIVGGVIGAVFLFLVNPMYAVGFAVFTLALQTCDGYIIKPRLFGSTLGVSLTWILIAIIVGGRVFGVIGIFLSIPGIAILDLIYHDYFLKWLEKRSEKKATEEEEKE